MVNTEHDLQEEIFFQFLVFSENLKFTSIGDFQLEFVSEANL